MYGIYAAAAAHPGQLLDRLLVERRHVERLAEASRMWATAMTVIQQTETALHEKKEMLLQHAWRDQAGQAFGDVVNDSLNSMRNWHGLIDSYGFPGGSVSDRIDAVVHQYNASLGEVQRITDQYRKAVESNDGKPPSDIGWYMAAADTQLGRYDETVDRLTANLRVLAKFATEWKGPRSAVPGSGTPGTPQPGTPAAGAADPGSAAATEPAAAEPVAVDPAAAPQDPAAAAPDPSQATDALSAAAQALQAAQGLLGGMQVPDPVAVPDPIGVDLDPAAYAESAYGSPTLSGLAGGVGGAGGVSGVGGIGGVGGAQVGTGGPGPGGALGAGAPPLSMTGTATAGGAAAGAGGMPPMYPPGAGAGAGQQRAHAGIKPGNSGQPVARERPRPRRTGAVTPGVALAGRAGAGAPTPAARRSWDSDNDSLQVLDEDLWQVNPQEEKTDGQDRRGSGRAARGRAPAQGAGHAGFDGQGGRTHQSPGAR